MFDFGHTHYLFILTGSLTETAHYQPLLEEINEILVLLNQEIED